MNVDSEISIKGFCKDQPAAAAVQKPPEHGTDRHEDRIYQSVVDLLGHRPENAAAAALYEKTGFHVTGIATQITLNRYEMFEITCGRFRHGEKSA